MLPLNVTAICEAHSAKNISGLEHSDCTSPNTKVTSEVAKIDIQAKKLSDKITTTLSSYNP